MNVDEKILIVDLGGNVRAELTRPTGTEFTYPEANEYYTRVSRGVREMGFEPSKVFSCTDVTYLDGRLYVVAGYCPGDFVVTASRDADGKWTWGPIAWGGKGDGPGRFRTAHGISAIGGSIYVANREAHQVCRFDPSGRYLGTIPSIPDGSRVCNISRAEADGCFIVNALEPVAQAQLSAPIYAHSGSSLISTIVPGDLGIPKLRHERRRR
jgi:hypothetical protein